MGIFSLFGKKDGQQTKPAEQDTSRTKRNAGARRTDGGKSGTRATAVKRDVQAQAALATALKIDAIESEMSSEFVQRPPASRSGAKPAKSTKPAAPLPASSGTTTEFLLDGASTVNDIATPSSEATAVIEEAAIMYANGQAEVVEQMLRAAIDEDMLGNTTQQAWQMLFDLYQITGKEQEFEQLSVAYVNKFETSPPTWVNAVPQNTPQAAPSGTTPIVPFSGKLNAGSIKQIERIRKLAETQHALRLEFGRVTAVDPAGCGLLLSLLKELRKSGHELVLVGIAELADRIRAIIKVERRDDTEEAWLLLLEILQLLNRETEFEETSIDYCVTFEVSPPAFAAPQTRVTTTTETPAAGIESEPEGFMMPPLIEGRIDNLIVAIAAYSDEHEPAIIDCSQLTRIDFNAAGRLLTGLAPFCGNGKLIELHHVNHLVMALFDVIGLKDIVRILPRKA